MMANKKSLWKIMLIMVCLGSYVVSVYYSFHYDKAIYWWIRLIFHEYIANLLTVIFLVRAWPLIFVIPIVFLCRGFGEKIIISMLFNAITAGLAVAASNVVNLSAGGQEINLLTMILGFLLTFIVGGVFLVMFIFAELLIKRGMSCRI